MHALEFENALGLTQNGIFYKHINNFQHPYADIAIQRVRWLEMKGENASRDGGTVFHVDL